MKLLQFRDVWDDRCKLIAELCVGANMKYDYVGMNHQFQWYPIKTTIGYCGSDDTEVEMEISILDDGGEAHYYRCDIPVDMLDKYTIDEIRTWFDNHFSIKSKDKLTGDMRRDYAELYDLLCRNQHDFNEIIKMMRDERNFRDPSYWDGNVENLIKNKVGVV